MRATLVSGFVTGGVVAAVVLTSSVKLSPAPTAPLNEATLPDSGFDDSGIVDSGFPDVSTSCQQQPFYGTVCSQPGTPGCAGFGGEGGAGGQGGGAAIALYVIGNSHVTMNNGAFFLAHGGQGGPGGGGGAGAPGDAGAPGSSQVCHSMCDFDCGVSGGFTLNGGNGGTGNSGGNGGNGGGGSGGPIYFYASVGATAPVLVGPVLDASMVVDSGGPGQGGSPNGQAGASGVSYP